MKENSIVEKISGINCLLELGLWDRDKVDKLLQTLRKSYIDINDRVMFLVSNFTGTPFEFESNLPVPPKNVLRVRLSSFDCITFVYTMIALSDAINFDDFVHRLLQLRYKDPVLNNIDSDPDTGNIFDFAYESLCINAQKKNFLRDITHCLLPNENLEKVSVELKRFKRPATLDFVQMHVTPRYGERVVSDIFIPKKYLNEINKDQLKSGDIILITKGQFNDNGEKIPVLITHLAVCCKEDDQIYFYHATKHFNWRSNAARDSETLYTGIFYDDEKKKEQIGVGLAGTFAGTELTTAYNGNTYFGFNQNQKRTIQNYLEINGIGIKVLRPISKKI